MGLKSDRPEQTTIFDFELRKSEKAFLDKEGHWLFKAIESGQAGTPQTDPGQAAPEEGSTPISGGLWYLAMSKSSGVRQFVASHPQATDECLEYLAKDSETIVRQFVASNLS